MLSYQSMEEQEPAVVPEAQPGGPHPCMEEGVILHPQHGMQAYNPKQPAAADSLVVPLLCLDALSGSLLGGTW